MFSSLSKWLESFSTTYKKALSGEGDGTGQTVYAEPITLKCYPTSDTVTLTKADGTVVVSNSQLYVLPKYPVGNLDIITFEGEDWSIQRVTKLRDKKANIVLQMVYL